MQAQILDSVKRFGAISLVALSCGLTSCATQKQVALVDDPNGKPESQLPWNKQEKWETGGQFQNLTDRR